MFDLQLFLGIKLSQELKKELSRANPYKVKTFINNDSSEYLQERSYEGEIYLGKPLEACPKFSELKQVQNNIESIICLLCQKKLVLEQARLIPQSQ